MENGLPPIARLRAQIEGEEFDYLALLRSLQDYAYPRDKITTMTMKRARRFATPTGLFIYRPATPAAYPLGIDLIEITGGSFLLAVAEKALADRVRDDRGSGITNVAGMERYLLDDLRIYPAGLAALDAACLEAIAAAYGSRKVRLLAAATRSLRQDHAEKQGAP